MDSNQTAKPKLSAAEAKALKAARLQVVRLQLTIHRELDDRGITTPDGVGAALGMPAAEAIALLNRKRLREGDLARLQAAAAQLGLRM
jgi:hypothetical protein